MVESTPANITEIRTCRHHWIIEAPRGTLSTGRCKLCGEERQFQNYVVPDYNNRGSYGSRPKDRDNNSDLGIQDGPPLSYDDRWGLKVQGSSGESIKLIPST